MRRAGETPEEREARILRLKAEVADGTYWVDSRNLAQSLVDTALRPRENNWRVGHNGPCRCDPPGSGEEFCNGACSGVLT